MWPFDNPPATPTPAADPAAVATNPVFNVPVLGKVLDTGRDLLVGPGNERLTTQEQVTRAILNTIVLAKSPEALPGLYNANAARDRMAQDTLGSPAFRARVQELTTPPDGTPGIPEAEAIKRAASEYQVSGGIALPPSIAGLPPVDQTELFNYGNVTSRNKDINEINSGSMPYVGESVSDDMTRGAFRRQAYQQPAMPQDAPILGRVQEGVAKSTVPYGTRRADGTPYYIGAPGSPSAPPPTQAGTIAPPTSAAPPGTNGMPSSGIVPPSPVTGANDARAAGAAPAPMSVEERVQKDAEMPYAIWNEKEQTLKVNPYNEELFTHPDGRTEVIFTPKPREQILSEEKELRDFYMDLEKIAATKRAERMKTLQGSLDEAGELAITTEAIVEMLQGYVDDPEVFPDHDEFSGEGWTDAGKQVLYEGNQLLRASIFKNKAAQNLKLKDFQRKLAPAAQLLAKAVTRGQVSDVDFKAFYNQLPNARDTWESATDALAGIPKLAQDIYNSRKQKLNEAQMENADADPRKRAAQPTPSATPAAPPDSETEVQLRQLYGNGGTF